MLIIGFLLIASAAAIKYLVVPQLSKLPEDANGTSAFEGTLRRLDPATFGLGTGIPVSVDRTMAVDQVEGDTAVVTTTAVSHLPSGDATDTHTYAINRVDYSQAEPPNAVPVEDQRGGVTLSFPMNPSTDDALVYDSVTRTAQPVSYTGTDTLAGREVYVFKGTSTAPVADPAVLTSLQAGIVALTRSGDGSTVPKAMLQAMIPALPADRAAAVQQALQTAPDQVPLAFTSVNELTLAVDTRFGSPLNSAQNRTTVLGIQSEDAAVPLVDLSQLQIATSEASIQASAAKFATNERKLNIVGVWVPLASALSGLVLIAVAILRRKPEHHGEEATSGSGGDARESDEQTADARG
ncbi:hypothetical protein BKE56_010300 [Rhodococcus sp. M8]|nr:hypothetical protein BKE56_010300 [Rhodococcus sp. M8]